MQTFVVRVWLADRPGALGAVASRVGAVGGDVVGIEILERGGGCAIDDLVVELPDGERVALLVHEISEVDGVDVEDVRPAADALHDPRIDALESAAQLVAATSTSELVRSLCERATFSIGAEWAALVDLDTGELRAQHGRVPSVAWLAAFIAGTRASARVAAMESGPDDVLWAPLPGSGLALVMGRDGHAFRARERRTAAALARLVDTRYCEITRRLARANHPSADA